MARNRSGISREALNPLRITGTPLPPNVLLAVKLIAVCFLLTQWRKLPRPFLPFVPILDTIATPSTVQTAIKSTFLIAAVLLLLNRCVRVCCLVLGGCVGLAVLSSRTYFANNRVFTACIFLLAGLLQPGQAPWFIRYQVVLVYLGAGLNKLLNKDWRSGQFFEAWTSGTPHHQRLQSALPWPPRWTNRLLSWLVIGVELFLVVGFSSKRLVPLSIWTGAAYHTALLVDTGSTFNMFYVAMLSAYLAFADWPTSVKVDYVASARPVLRLVQLLELTDSDRMLVTRAHRRAAVPLSVTLGRRRFQNWSAARMLVLLHAPSYVLFTVALSLLDPRRWGRWLALAVLTAVSASWVVNRRSDRG
jgi:hypothetical protein